MKFVILEDEKHNSLMLEVLVKDIRPEWELVTVLDKVSSAIDWFKTNTEPDLVFMDIQLKDGISFSILEQVKIKCPVIFTTAYDKYAMRAFEVTSVDYLLKPVEEKRLLGAIERFEEVFDRDIQPENDYSEILRAIREGKKEYRKRFLVAEVDSYRKIDVQDIAYFKVESNICSAVLFSKKEHIIDYTLDKLEGQLDPEIFFRANRHIILNIESIQKIENYFGGKLAVMVQPPMDETVKISRLKAKAFKDWVDG